MSDEARALLSRAVRLKHVDRAGWLRAGVRDPESVAAHSYGVALAALVLAEPTHDLGKLLAMALLHDLAEVETGDVTPYDGVSIEEKRRREAEAFDRLLGARPELRAIVHELEAGESPEARLVKRLDKVDMALTAEIYAARGHEVDEFRESAGDAMRHTFGDRDAGSRGGG